MARASSLSLSFLETRPYSAARTLAEMPAGDAAGFLDTIPSRYVVLALGHMGQWTSADVMRLMEPASAAAAIREMEQVSAAATLRLLDKAKRAELLGLLPEAKRRELDEVLAFPEDSVGAHMQTALITVPQDATIDLAIAAFKGAPGIETNLIYIVGASRKLCGVARANTLLSGSSSARIIDIVDPDIESVSSRARLEAVATLVSWDEFSELPVLNRRKQLIGAITRKALRAGIGLSQSEKPEDTGSILGEIAGAFITSLVGMSHLLVDASPARSKMGALRE